MKVKKKLKEKKIKDEFVVVRKMERKNQEKVVLCIEKEILLDLSSQLSLEFELNKKLEEGIFFIIIWRLCKLVFQFEVIFEI